MTSEVQYCTKSLISIIQCFTIQKKQQLLTTTFTIPAGIQAGNVIDDHAEAERRNQVDGQLPEELGEVIRHRAVRLVRALPLVLRGVVWCGVAR